MKRLLVLALVFFMVFTAQASTDEEDELEDLIEKILRRHRIEKGFSPLNSTTQNTTQATLTTTAVFVNTTKQATTTAQPPPTNITISQTSKVPVPVTTTTTQLPAPVKRTVEVYSQVEEIWAETGTAAQLFCDYSVTSGEDLPVTVTWRVGDGPRLAHPIFVCTGWTHTFKSCSSMQIKDVNYEGRVRIAQDSPSLEITNVQHTDNRNYWCQVSVEKPNDYELEFDMQSMVLRLYDGEATPKFHTTAVDDDIVATVGKNVTIDCVCQTGYHCEDVHWYKGPLNSTDTSYVQVYSRTSHSRPVPTQYKAYNQWQERAFLTGNALTIIGVRSEDNGRYWCELRASGFYAIGEWATDAESMVLEVREEQVGKEPFDCLSKPDGLYADPDNCSDYFECEANKAHHRNCPAGTVFNSNQKSNTNSYVCDYPDNVAPPCGTKITR